MPRLLVMLALLASAAPTHTAAQDPRDIVREDVRAMSAGDGQALVDLFDDRSRIYVLPTLPHQLAGGLSSRIGTQSQREAAFLTPPPAPPPPVEIVEMIAFDQFVAARLKTGPAGESALPTSTLVLFRIDGPIITDLWHLVRTDTPLNAADPDPRAVVSALDGADAAGLYTDDAAFYETSLSPGALGDLRVELPTATDRAARSRESVALKDLVVSREVGLDAAGQAVERLAVYRVTGGRISHRWRLASRPIA